MSNVRPLLALSILLAMGSGCSLGPKNPSFALEPSDARAALRKMGAEARPLDRPLVILAGFADPGIGPFILRTNLRPAIGAENERTILAVTFATCGSFEGCRRRVISAVDRAFPTDDPHATTEVDVIGLSMGGIVARYAAAEPPPPEPGRAPARRLRIRRLFTISSPHRGATLAALPALLPLHSDLRIGSAFMERLARTTDGADYELTAYVRLGDPVVGPANAAPLGQVPHWVPNLPFQAPHGHAWGDPRILADIVRRLRGERPFADDQAAPLPGAPPVPAGAAS